MRDFEYFEPKSVSEASALLSRYGAEARAIAGGTDLLVEMKQDRLHPAYLVNLKSIPNLDYIMFDEQDGLTIKALTTLHSIEKSEVIRQKYPILHQVARHFGSASVRNMATIGGNICHGIPSADTAPALLVLSATARVAGSGIERDIALDYFFSDYGKTALVRGEILTEIHIPVMLPHTRGTYIKYAIRSGTDLPVVGVAVVIVLSIDGKTCRDIKIALGNVAPTPVRACNAEEALRGKKPEPELIDKCAKIAADGIRPRSGSIRASADYKKAMVKHFTALAIQEALAQEDWK